MAIPPPSKGQKSPAWVQKSLSWASRVCRPPVVSTLSTGLIVLTLRAVGALQGLELGVYDQMLRSRPLPEPDDRILVVGIDEADIQSRQEWPIQDKTLAELLEVVLAGDPHAVGLDMLRDVPIGEGQNALLSQIQSSDRIFPVCTISSLDTPGVPPPAGTPEFQVSFSDLVVDPGGILRRSLLVAAPPADSQTINTHLCNSPDAQLFSLALQLAAAYLAAEADIEPAPTDNGEIKLGETVLSQLTSNTGSYRNVDAEGYQIMLNYRAAEDSVPSVSLSEVLSGAISSDTFRDRIVLIGTTTPEAKDEFYTPFSGGLQDNQKMPGVMVHAQSTSQILSAVLDDRPLIWSWSSLSEGVWIVVCGLGGALFAAYVRRPLPYAFGALFLVGGLYGACYLILLQGGWIPLVPPAVALILASGGVVLLDRFNKSDYGQAVYKQMKSLLRIEIAIDQTKVGQQVAEITETDYFSQLQSQAKELRERRRAENSDSVTVQRHNSDDAFDPKSSSNQNEDDYFESLKRKALDIKATSKSEPDDESENSSSV